MNICVGDHSGAFTQPFRFAHTASGWAEFTEKMKPFAGCPLTLETSSGPAVDQLLQRGWSLYPIAPTAAAHSRQRTASSGTKSDRHDTWSMADALRTDGHAWRPLRPQDEATVLWRALCRDEMSLIEQRTLLVNQLQAALQEYYPAALEAFADWTAPSAWAFVPQFSTPQFLQQAGQKKWEKFLHTHTRWRPQTREQRLSLFAAANALHARASITRAQSLLAVSPVKLLLTLQTQLDEYRRQIAEAFRRHPDHGLVGGLPGAKAVLSPRLLAELGNVRAEYPDAESLMCQAGVSPLSYQSGQIDKCRRRRACNQVLRQTVHLWVNARRATCAWAQDYYQLKRGQGHSHASALRCLGKRWLKILWRVWYSRTPYDEAIHLKDQQRRGRVIWNQLQATPAAATVR